MLKEFYQFNMSSQPNPFNPNQPEPLLIVISGPSGVGKDTVIKRMKERELPVQFVVTATTREPRDNEQDGVDYYFVSPDRFAEMIENGELLEYAIVYNDYKGIPKAQVKEALETGKDVILRVDVQGAATIRHLCKDALLIFLTTQDEVEMVKRLKDRKSDSPEGINLRIATAKQELKRIHEFDYVVVNPECQLDKAVDTILAIIEAEHHRVNHRKVTL